MALLGRAVDTKEQARLEPSNFQYARQLLEHHLFNRQVPIRTFGLSVTE